MDGLFLPDDDPAAPFEGALLEGVVVVPGGVVAVAFEELADGVCLDADAGPD